MAVAVAVAVAVASPLFLLLLCLVPGVAHAGNDTDRLALFAFKAEITIDPFGALNSWNQSTHFCQWLGVTCGRRHQRVTMLILDSQDLHGPISPHIGNLSFLRVLWLGNNSFTHQIPPQVGRLKRLQFLWLGNNSITGEIPANISRCSKLTGLYLSGNLLSGKMPQSFGSLSKLEDLYIANNTITGEIPSGIGNLSSLRGFAAQLNEIGGNIPDTFGRLTNLEFLLLYANRLVGTIPSSIFNLSSLTQFIVTDNRIQGSLPLELGITLPNLQLLEVGMNLFSGSLPISLSNATRLSHIGFGRNELTGKVPSFGKLHNLKNLVLDRNHLGTGEANDLSFLNSLINATNLNVLSLSSNNFGGLLPSTMSNFSTSISRLNLENNSIVGRIPNGLGNLVNLRGIGLSINHLTGKIPASIGKLQKLWFLSLFGNNFYGEIPSTFGNLTSLGILRLFGNNLHGNIPSSLGKCQMLLELRLQQNKLIGTIPKELMSLSGLLFLTISQNNLTGSLSVEIENLKNLEELRVSENKLSGKIPSSLGSCTGLRLLYLKDNSFWGVLPPSISNLRGIEELDLSHNNFSGKIPEYFEGFLFLQKLNLSFNDFDGVVPKRGIFTNATAVSIKGNKKLCGGIAELMLQSCNSNGFRKKSFTLSTNLIISIGFGLLGLTLMSSFLYFCWFRKPTKISSFRFFGNSFLELSYQSLLKATGGFSPENLVGVGGFGSVYKGILDQGGKVVAVKVLNLQFHGASKSFIAECKALKHIKHRNLVKVLTACSSIDFRGNDFKALVYEFMVNGSLEDWVHSKENEDEAHEDPRNLSLMQRLCIAIDVASALDYLHHHCTKPIVHCDLKPSNVLLDDAMIGHVSDFGLARFLLEANHNSSANQSSSIGVRGSVGYVAPEYGMGSEASRSGDVYSYGILLLEMFMGKRPTDNMFNDGLNLHNFAKMALPEQVASVVDPTLFKHRETGGRSSSINNAQKQSSASIQECLISVLKIGIVCSEEQPNDRPAINEVVTQLCVIKNTLLGSGLHG